jgi:GntR family transcriptional regulator/MocR family aminotransferase
LVDHWLFLIRIGSPSLDRVLDLAFRPDPTRREPVYRQLADHLAALIDAERLRAGERLPPTRELAQALALSRNTVARAYEWLIEAGWLGAHVGRGTFVQARAAAAHAPRAVLPVPSSTFAWPALFASRTRALRGLRPPRARDDEPVRFDFRPGRVDLAGLPIAELQGAWQRAVGRLRDHGNDFDPLGFAPLRAAVARSLAGRGIARSADQVMITSGAQQALDLVARALVEPGDVVAMEDPGYFLAGLAFRSCGAHLVGVGVDAEGLRVDELARVLRSRRVKLAYVTPSAQVPTGAALSAARRAALLELSDRAQMPVLEDDYDCELRQGAPAALALAAMDGGDRVVYAGTFSKALFPGLRLGYVVAAPALLRALASLRSAATFQPSLLDQMAVAELLSRDSLERHVRRVRKRYAERGRALAEALAGSMPEGTVFREPRGGSAIWVELPPGVDTDALAAAAHERGIAYGSGEPFRVEGEGRPALLLSFAALPPDAIRLGVAELAELVRQQGDRARGAARRA